MLPVQVAAARREPIQRIITADGILRALDQSTIMPKISAPVSKFFVNRGDHVKKGQLLAMLENRDLAAAVADAKGAYDQAAAAYRSMLRPRFRMRWSRRKPRRRRPSSPSMRPRSCSTAASSYTRKARWPGGWWMKRRWPTRRPRASPKPR